MNTATTNRIASIDILRGMVMVIMALDHTRDFFHSTAITDDPLNPATTSGALFFTRWITHFCAPIFVLLSGLSAYLSLHQKPRNEASLFLLKRGIWLVVAEVVIITLGLTFNPFYNFIILQVIWAIGWSMVILGLLIRTSPKVILVSGLLLVLGHNALDYATLPREGAGGMLWTLLLTSRGAVSPLNATHFVGAFYAILPWTGVMLLGYSIGPWFSNEFPGSKRRRLLLMSGTLLILLFVVLRLSRGYGDPGAWNPREHPLFSFLDTSKYPPSLQYCSMTLGPALLLLAILENVRSGFTGVISVYGRVPFFYYILHFYLLHSLLVIVFFATGHSSTQIADPRSIFAFRPANFGFGLVIVYIIWLAVVAALYFPCKWFRGYKISHRQWWLKYI